MITIEKKTGWTQVKKKTNLARGCTVYPDLSAGLSVCFDLPFIGSAGGCPDLDSIIT